MAEKSYPYISAVGSISAAISQFRKSLPAKIDAATLKKLGLAPLNESYLINILRFIGVIDDDGNRTPEATTTFSQHEDSEFQKGFDSLVSEAYGELHKLHGDSLWSLEPES